MKGSTFKRKKNNAEQIKTAVEIMKKSELNLISNGIKSCLVESTIRFFLFFLFSSQRNGICWMLISVSSTWLCVIKLWNRLNHFNSIRKWISKLLSFQRPEKKVYAIGVCFISIVMPISNAFWCKIFTCTQNVNEIYQISVIRRWISETIAHWNVWFLFCYLNLLLTTSKNAFKNNFYHQKNN